MPIYEYKCDDCGTKFEKLVRRASEAADVGCPSCGQNHVQQEFSTFAPGTPAASGRNEAPVCPGGMCANPGVCGRN